MKPTPEETPRQIVWLSKLELAIHDAVSATPEDPALIELLANQFAAGEPMHDPIEITPDKDILDGRHRWRAAKRTERMTLVPCVFTDADPEHVVLTKLSQRRHYSKSARAYALRHHAAKVAQASREAAARGLKVGSRHPTQLGHGKKGSETLEELAAKSGLSEELLRQAIKLERDYMTRADKLIEDWLDTQFHADDRADWFEYQQTHLDRAMPWSCWRAEKLRVQFGLRDTDPKAVNVIPKNYREIEEDKIFNGVADLDADPGGDDRKSYSLGASLKAMGSIFATAGKPRPDLDPSQPAICITLQNKLRTFTKTMWAQWESLSVVERQEVCKSLQENLTEWPVEARRSLFAKLKEEWK